MIRSTAWLSAGVLLFCVTAFPQSKSGRDYYNDLRAHGKLRLGFNSTLACFSDDQSSTTFFLVYATWADNGSGHTIPSFGPYRRPITKEEESHKDQIPLPDEVSGLRDTMISIYKSGRSPETHNVKGGRRQPSPDSQAIFVFSTGDQKDEAAILTFDTNSWQYSVDAKTPEYKKLFGLTRGQSQSGRCELAAPPRR